MTPRCRRDTPADASAVRSDGCPSIAVIRDAHVLRMSMSIPWSCLSMIYAIFLCDHDHPLLIVVWSSTAYHDDTHGRTMIACDAWRLPVKAPDVWRGYWPVSIHIPSLYAFSVWHEKNILMYCSICFQGLGFASPGELIDVIRSYDEATSAEVVNGNGDFFLTTVGD